MDSLQMAQQIIRWCHLDPNVASAEILDQPDTVVAVQMADCSEFFLTVQAA